MSILRQVKCECGQLIDIVAETEEKLDRKIRSLGSILCVPCAKASGFNIHLWKHNYVRICDIKAQSHPQQIHSQVVLDRWLK